MDIQFSTDRNNYYINKDSPKEQMFKDVRCLCQEMGRVFPYGMQEMIEAMFGDARIIGSEVDKDKHILTIKLDHAVQGCIHGARLEFGPDISFKIEPVADKSALCFEVLKGISGVAEVISMAFDSQELTVKFRKFFIVLTKSMPFHSQGRKMGWIEWWKENIKY